MVRKVSCFMFMALKYRTMLLILDQYERKLGFSLFHRFWFSPSFLLLVVPKFFYVLVIYESKRKMSGFIIYGAKNFYFYVLGFEIKDYVSDLESIRKEARTFFLFCKLLFLLSFLLLDVLKSFCVWRYMKGRRNLLAL